MQGIAEHAIANFADPDPEALKDLELELGLRSPETTPVTESSKEIGPAAKVDETQTN